jgi:hypothetical protein
MYFNNKKHPKKKKKKKKNKKTIHYLILKNITWENKNKTFMHVSDITKKCYKLACMDGVKT